MLFADADPFWKPPTVYDAVGVISFVAGLASIWLSWWLARRDLEARIDRAERRAAAAIHLLILREEVAAIRRHVELANEAQMAANWRRAEIHVEEARGRMTRVVNHPTLRLSAKNTLRLSSDRLTALTTVVRSHPRKGQGRLTEDQQALLITLLTELQAVEGELFVTTAGEQ